MNKSEKEEQPGAVERKHLWPFILATLCSVPGWVSLCSIAMAWLRTWLFFRRHPGEASYTTHFWLCFPLVTILEFIALCLIFVSWFDSPRWCRFILAFYVLLLVIWVIWILNPGEGYGP